MKENLYDSTWELDIHCSAKNYCCGIVHRNKHDKMEMSLHRSKQFMTNY